MEPTASTIIYHSFLIILTFLWSVVAQVDYTPYINRKIFSPCLKPVCYDQVGCFQPFRLHAYLSTPPVAACPEDPKDIGFTIRILRARNTYEFFSTRYIEPQSKIAFYIHGFQMEYSERFAMELTYTLLKKYPQVALVKWDPGSYPNIIWDVPVARFNRYTAAANSELIGRLVGNSIVETIEKQSIHPDDVTIIGHSLGGNAIHFAAEWLKEKYNITLGRAIVLDQDGVPFYFSNKKLTSSGDAKIVDCIHSSFVQPIPLVGQRLAGTTNTGSMLATCDTDYYVNFPDAVNDQEGCEGLQFCSKNFAVLTYSAYLNNCTFKTISCSSLSPIKNSESVGIDSEKYGKRGKICIKTSPRPLSTC